MRFLVISDTHGIFKSIYEQNKAKLTGIDQVILLGDHSYTDVAQILDIWGLEKCMGVYGNHDTPDTYKNVHCFDHELVEHGFTYTGLNGSHRYKPTQIFGYSQQESIDAAKSLPKADVLFSHDGTYNADKDEAHCGLKGITWYIKANNPKAVIFGHLHKPSHDTVSSMFNKETEVYCVYQMALVDFNEDGTVQKLEQLEII